MFRRMGLNGTPFTIAPAFVSTPKGVAKTVVPFGIAPAAGLAIAEREHERERAAQPRRPRDDEPVPGAESDTADGRGAAGQRETAGHTAPGLGA